MWFLVITAMHGLDNFTWTASHVSSSSDAETIALSFLYFAVLFANWNLEADFFHSIPTFSHQIRLITRNVPFVTRFIYVSPEHWYLFSVSRVLNPYEILGKHLYISASDSDRLCLLVRYALSDDFTIPTGVNNYTTTPLSEDFMQGVYTNKYPKKDANGDLPDGEYVYWPLPRTGFSVNR